MQQPRLQPGFGGFDPSLGGVPNPFEPMDLNDLHPDLPGMLSRQPGGFGRGPNFGGPSFGGGFGSGPNFGGN